MSSIKLAQKIVGYSVRKHADSTGASSIGAIAPVPLHDPDRRIVIKLAIGVAERSLRWPKRPRNTDGFQAWTSDFIRTPVGKFALAISYFTNGHLHPFEVWGLAREQPQMTWFICEHLSKVLQTDDVAFISYHLEALKKAFEAPFDLAIPHQGTVVRADSIGAAIAFVVEAHLLKLGYLGTTTPSTSSSPMLSAMTSIREPRTEGQGGVGWQEQVVNRGERVNHDFVVFIKEALLEDGRIFPLSLWLGGLRVPPESEAICKLASLAMRHSDPKWTADFFKLLRTHENRDEEFRAIVPGTQRQHAYASTWAYVAELVLYRYRMLGILDDAGDPIEQGHLFAPESLEDESPVAAASGEVCPSCHQAAVQRQGGCPTCLACGYSKC